jgi:hypothetical protein
LAKVDGNPPKPIRVRWIRSEMGQGRHFPNLICFEIFKKTKGRDFSGLAAAQNSNHLNFHNDFSQILDASLDVSHFCISRTVTFRVFASVLALTDAKHVSGIIKQVTV